MQLTTPFSRPARIRALAIFFGVALTLLGAFGFYQATSPLLHCGRFGTDLESRAWIYLAAAQSALFMAAALGPRMGRAFLVSQWLAAPWLLIVLGQLAAAHPRISALLLAGGAAHLAASRLLESRTPPHGSGQRSTSHAASRWLACCADAALFLVVAWLVQSTLAFYVLHTPNVTLTDTRFYVILAVSCAIAHFLVGFVGFRAQVEPQALPPLFLLVAFLLRAKSPDGSFDALLYKATSPLMIADWRTAITGLPDHTLLGTNLLEIANSQLRILDPSHSPAIATALAYLALWLVAPAVVAPMRRGAPAGRSLAAHAFVLLIVSLTEPLVAAGTSHQEPAIVLFMTASLLPGPLGWFLMAAAAATKVTALFFVPCLALARGQLARLDAEGRAPAERIRPEVQDPAAPALGRRRAAGAGATALCLMLAVLAFGGQLYRNYVFSGRILAPSEAFAAYTDPDGRFLARVDHETAFDAVVQRSFADVLTETVLHMLTLDLVEKTEPLGFHVFPSSRVPLLAILLGAAGFVAGLRSYGRSGGALVLVYAACFLVLLRFFSQGRHLAAASAAGCFVFAWLLFEVFDRTAGAPGQQRSAGARLFLALGVAFFAAADQRVGSFINAGWDCTRNLWSPVTETDYEAPTSPLEVRLRRLAERYRGLVGSDGVVPTFLCHPKTGPKPYLGANHVFAFPSISIVRRHLQADPRRLERLSRSALAMCASLPELPIPGREPDGFELAEEVDGVAIFVSRSLLTGGRARSLSGAGFRWPFLSAPDGASESPHDVAGP